jgi:hypothetical protein
MDSELEKTKQGQTNAAMIRKPKAKKAAVKRTTPTKAKVSGGMDHDWARDGGFNE